MIARIYSGPLCSYFGSDGAGAAAIWISTNIPFLRRSGVSVSEWSEDPERPALSIVIPAAAYEAFLLRAASVRSGIAMLDRIPAGFSASSHPALIRLMDDGGIVWGRALQARLFVPSEDIFAYATPFPSGITLEAASTAALGEILGAAGRGWDAKPYEIISWSDPEKTEGKAILKRLCGDESAIDGDAGARLAFSALYRALLFSRFGGTPVIISMEADNGRIQR